MKLNKVTTIEALTTDDKVMQAGTEYLIIIADKSLCGTFKGFSKKGALMFAIPLSGEDTVFNIMPSSIKKIFEATIEVKQAYMNPPEQEEPANEN